MVRDRRPTREAPVVASSRYGRYRNGQDHRVERRLSNVKRVHLEPAESAVIVFDDANLESLIET
jgi:hypothetical protein